MSDFYTQYIRSPQNEEEQKIFDLQELYKGPVPPVQFSKSVKAFWLSYVDSDGRVWPPEPYSWQPGAKRWCSINHEATGQDIDLRNWVIVGEVIMPDFPVLDIDHRAVVTRVVGGKPHALAKAKPTFISSRATPANYSSHLAHHIPLTRLADDGFGTLYRVSADKQIYVFKNWYEAHHNTHSLMLHDTPRI